MRVSEKHVIRELGFRCAEIAALPVQKEKRDLWRAVNGLHPVRPTLAIDNMPWNELDVDDELRLRTTDPFLREIEESLRRTLYRWKHMPADMVVEPYFEVYKALLGTDIGMQNVIDDSIIEANNAVVGHAYHNQCVTEDDIQKIHMADVRPDVARNRFMEEAASEALAGALPVRMVGETGFFALWDRLTEWMSPEAILYDLADRPDFIHAIMERYTTVTLKYIDQMEAQGLFEPAQNMIHCTYAYADDLPAPGFDPAMPRAKDSWAFGMAQIFATVSPAMHEEFEVEYVNRIFERFGLVYYGCCEALHDRIHVVRKIPNVRKISCSPFCDVDIAADAIGKDYVVSRKSSPAWLASVNPDWGEVEKDFRNTLSACRRSGSPVEFILKDLSTVKHRPQNLWEWEKRAMRIIQGS